MKVGDLIMGQGFIDFVALTSKSPLIHAVNDISPKIIHNCYCFPFLFRDLNFVRGVGNAILKIIVIGIHIANILSMNLS